MSILAFAASHSRQSINKQLVTYAASLLQQQVDVTVQIADLNDFVLPIYSVDLEEAHGIPELAQQFYQNIGAADGLLISFAEHNGLYAAVFKNLMDWMSRIDVKLYQHKPTVMLATSPGPGGAQRVLGIACDSAAHFGADLRARLSVPDFYNQFDQQAGRLTSTELDQALQQAVAHLV
ncbi:MAG: NAD(P)H-dependent oxidoreductase [Pseudomonadota bacterium]